MSTTPIKTRVRKLSMKDLADSPADFIVELGKGLRDCGFVVLRDHGIPKSHLEEAYKHAEALFALPLETKLQYDVGSGGQRGYTAFGKEKAAGRSVADLKEFWHIGPDLEQMPEQHRQGLPNQWPAEIPEFKACFESLYVQLESLGRMILHAIGEGLGNYGALFQEMATHGNSICRILHYPPIENAEAQASEAGEVSMRAAPHADINLLTLLVGASDSGLQLFDKSGAWVPVESSADEIVVDTGDMMARLTNNRIPSTVHRVVNESTGGGARYSMPFFLHPRDEVSLACLPECKDGDELPEITAGAFLEQRLRENGLI